MSAGDMTGFSAASDAAAVAFSDSDADYDDIVVEPLPKKTKSEDCNEPSEEQTTSGGKGKSVIEMLMYGPGAATAAESTGEANDDDAGPIPTIRDPVELSQKVAAAQQVCRDGFAEPKIPTCWATHDFQGVNDVAEVSFPDGTTVTVYVKRTLWLVNLVFASGSLQRIEATTMIHDAFPEMGDVELGLAILRLSLRRAYVIKKGLPYLDFNEKFAGSAMHTTFALMYGLTTASLDKIYGSMGDITSGPGFRTHINATTFVKPGGEEWYAPQMRFLRKKKPDAGIFSKELVVHSSNGKWFSATKHLKDSEKYPAEFSKDYVTKVLQG
mmetsp:Transcript_74599/g.130408  ORF Transcript_74599/g.130408 Transcript_74599/m.130408 type:complete len:326 (+) Transcript_74599:99-1076(+)